MILFIPNYSLLSSGPNYIFPESDIKFLMGLSGSVSVTVLAHLKEAGTNATGEYSNSYIPSSNAIGYSLIGLGEASVLGKAWLYLKTMAVCFFKAATFKGIFYIYYPGNIAFIAAIFARLLGRPYALYVRGDWTYRKDFKFMTPWILRKARFVIVTGPGFACKVAKHNTKVSQVVPMIATVGKEKKKDYSISAGLPLVLFVGRMEKEKGIFDLLTAAIALLRSGVRFKCIFVGGGKADEIAEFRRLVKLNRMGPYIEYKGRISEQGKLAELYKSANVFAFPSYYREGFPRVIYEAMSYGLPIVCTILTGMEGLMEDGNNCLSVKPCAPKDLELTLKQLLDDEDAREYIGSNGYSKVTEYLSSLGCKNHSDQVLDLYSEWRNF